MNLKDLSKEQKQYLILGAMGAVAVLGAAVFGVKFTLSSIGVARVELQELTDKIEQADRSLSNNQRDEEAFIKTISELRVYLEKIPPDQNYYSWATEIIYGKARTAHLEIESINESRIPKQKQSEEEADAVAVESYSLSITAHGGYDSVKHFLQEISQEYPLVRITGLEISTGSKPDIHDIQLFIQWPFKLKHMAEAWENVPEAPHVLEAVVANPERPKPELQKEPTPPAPRISPDPKPVEQSVAKAAPELETSAPPIVRKKRPEPEFVRIPPTAVVEVIPDERPVEEMPKEAVVFTPQESPPETNKSVSRLEALLRQMD